MKPIKTLSDWLATAESTHSKSIELGLERVRVVKDRLGIHLDCPIIIVGGTNGKGSTCAMLQAIWEAAGYRIGLYTSPHFHRFNERIQVTGQIITDAVLVEHFEQVDRARGEIRLTYFEFTTLVIMSILANTRLDAVILEVGLGGRLDAVNIFDAHIAIVTNVSIEHTDYLGTTLEKIAYEKAGIYRSNRTAIYGEVDPPQSLLQYASDIQANLKVLKRDYDYAITGNQWCYQGKQLRLQALDFPVLYGKNQIQNAANALTAIEAMMEYLPVNESAIRAGLAKVRLHGRFEIIGDNPKIILDVGHNPHAIAALAKNLQYLREESGESSKVHAIFGTMADKDIRAMLSIMKDYADHWYFVDLPTGRAAKASQIEEILRHIDPKPGNMNHNVAVFPKVSDALRVARSHAQKNDTIIAFGSFWVIARMTQDHTPNS